MHIVIRLFKRGVSHIAHEIRKHGNDIFSLFSPTCYIGTRKVVPEVVWPWLNLAISFEPCRKPYLSEINGIDDADMILPLGPGKNILV